MGHLLYIIPNRPSSLSLFLTHFRSLQLSYQVKAKNLKNVLKKKKNKHRIQKKDVVTSPQSSAPVASTTGHSEQYLVLLLNDS